jgi:hypothetical protein
MKPWEYLLAIVMLFLVCSTSLYWYDYYNKTTKHSLEAENKKKWESETRDWQGKVTNSMNAVIKSQKEIVDVINFNIHSSRLVMPVKK